MSGHISRMRRPVKARHFMIVGSRRGGKKTAETEPANCVRRQIRLRLFAVAAVAARGSIEGDSHRNAGAGGGAGGRRTLHGNQRHSATGKRTPEMKRRRRDEHNGFEMEKAQPKPRCWSNLVALAPSLSGRRIFD